MKIFNYRVHINFFKVDNVIYMYYVHVAGKFGDWAVFLSTAKLKSSKISATCIYVIVARPRQDCMVMHGCHAVLSGSCNYFVIQSTHFIWYLNSIHTWQWSGVSSGAAWIMIWLMLFVG